MTPPYWTIMPVVNSWTMTQAAIADCLAQVGLPSPPQLLVINSGLTRDERDQLDRWAEREPRLHVWHHTPGLPSLSATWNLGLRFVWSQGGEVALVVNNDVRLHPQTYELLLHVARQPIPEPGEIPLELHDTPLVVSAVGRREADMDWDRVFAEGLTFSVSQRGGPDYSCFLITREGHQRYPFDEGFVPAYCDDLDHHRRMLLNGEGHRIFSVNLPYLHYGSATVNADPSKRSEWARRIEQARAHYRRKWGGDVNEETFIRPFDETSATVGVTTPELQRRHHLQWRGQDANA